MRTIVFCFVLSGLEAFIQGELISTFIEEGKYTAEVVQELWPQLENLRTSHNESQIQRKQNGERALQIDLFTTLNHYLTDSLKRSVESLLDWTQIVRWMTLNAGSYPAENRRIGYFQEMKLKKELIFLVLLIILKTLGVLVTKVKIAIGMMFLKLLIGKIIFFYMHLKSKHHHGPLIKAYQTTTNEFHSHLGHEYKHRFGNGEPFFPSPPNFYDHSERK